MLHVTYLYNRKLIVFFFTLQFMKILVMMAAVEMASSLLSKN